MLVLAVIAFIGVFAFFIQGQVLHARRLGAEYGRLQAIYAAESGVYASFAAVANVSSTTLWAAEGNSVKYQGSLEASSFPTWITGTGTVDLRGQHFVATVRGYAVGNRILLWDFDS
jgi:hypothetical protein